MKAAKSALFVVILTLAGSTLLPAQTPTQVESPEKQVVIQGTGGVGMAGGQIRMNGPANGIVSFFAMESFEGKPVKGAPYSADAVSESVQTLVDGNRIVQKNSSAVYRDAEGRTRREESFAVRNETGVTTRTSIFINDPVLGVSYILDPENKVAHNVLVRRMALPGSGEKGVTMTFEAAVTPPPAAGVRGSGVMMMEHRVEGPAGSTRDAKTESLGKQTIEGLEAEGIRTTMTIPAWQMGNERSIEIVSERWYSPKLQTVLLSTRNDPRFGATSYKLSNISQNEPAASLFQVPPDYKIEEGKQTGIRMEYKKENR